MKDEKNVSFLSEFFKSWVGILSICVIFILGTMCFLLYLEFPPFNNLSTYLSEDKYNYTFTMVQIAVSILAFAALVWSISYQRDELVQSRRELKTQSEDVNRSINETNKNFDRALLLEFYKKINNEIKEVDFVTSSFIVKSQYRIYRDDVTIVDDLATNIGRLEFTSPSLKNLLLSIKNELEKRSADDDEEDKRNSLIQIYNDVSIRSAITSVEDQLADTELSILILLHDMIFYAKNKGISFNEPVFSLLKTSLKKSQFFIDNKTLEDRLDSKDFYNACVALGLIHISVNEKGVPIDREFKQGINDFIESLHTLDLICDPEDFWEGLL